MKERMGVFQAIKFIIFRILKNIFACKNMDVCDQNKRFLKVQSSNAKSILFVSSYPRSGNTWVRYLLADCLIQNMGISTASTLPVHPDKIIPDRYLNPISECDTSIKTPGYCVKTHDCYYTSMGLISKNGFNNVRHIYIGSCPV
jgi:hypothetical protein